MFKKFLMFSALALAFVVTAGAADKGGCGGPPVCEYNGKTYQTGESFPSKDGCNSCSCDNTGQVICTLKACVRGCSYNGKNYKPGESYPAKDGCNTCTCQKDGTSACTKKACPKRCGTRGGIKCAKGEFCNFGGPASKPGQAVCGETDLGGTCKKIPTTCYTVYKPVCGCDNKTYGNDCEAHAKGVSIKSNGKCSTKPPVTCKVGGKEYKPGDTYPSADGCNTCSCQKDGTSICTKRACTKTCGGLLGTKCAKGEFCDLSNPGKLQCGEADGTGVCKPKPQGCNKPYAPVCGCNGKDYSNECMAHLAGVSVKSKGRCGGVKPTTCAYNGKTYKPGDSYPAKDGCNKCTCQKDGSSACTEKACVKTCGGMRPPGSAKCAADEFCDLSNPGKLQCGEADGGGVCKKKPKGCTKQYAPVCGCNGKTYGNECMAHAAGVSVKSKGKCTTTPPKIKCKDDCDCIKSGNVCQQGYCAPDKRPKLCPACGSKACKPGLRCYNGKIGRIEICGGTTKRCGTRGGITCAKGEFCNFSNPSSKYQCGETDLGGVCQKRPRACTQQYAPVCGCNGKTYGNACTAHSAGVSVKSKGKCTTTPPKIKCKDDCDCIKSGNVCHQGYCAPLKRANLCPACGSKACKPGLRCYNGKIGRIEICGGTTKRCGTRGGITCAKGEFCNFSNPSSKYQCGETDLGGVCQKRPQACNQLYAPVCGCNGKTYGNACAAHSAGVSVKYKGKCKTTKPKSCTYNGKIYAHLTGWPAADGCNKCSCNDGKVTCTTRACPPKKVKCKDDCDCVSIGQGCQSGYCAPVKRLNLCPKCGASNCKPGKRCWNGKGIGVCTASCKDDCDCVKIGKVCHLGQCLPLRRMNTCKKIACKSDCDCIKTGNVCHLGFCAPLKRANMCIKCGSSLCKPGKPCWDGKGIGVCTASCKDDCDCVKIGKVCHLGQCLPLRRMNTCKKITCKSDCDCIKTGNVCHLGFCAPLKRANMCIKCGSSLCKPGKPCWDGKGVGVCQGKGKPCNINGQVIKDGGSFYDGCNTCSCRNGLLLCTKRACPNLCGVSGGKRCGKDEFCARPQGKCGYGGTCKKRPTGCYRLYKPVCGCNRKTYSNDCVAYSAGQSIASTGACQ